MAIATIRCPKCAQTFRSSDDVKDTRIRCPLCGAAFVVKEFAKDAAPGSAETKANAEEDEGDGGNPYEVTSRTVMARCPNCANEMESESAVICLYCGYNTQTRTLGQTTRVVQQTGIDQAKWLMPGILCLIGILALVFFQNLFVLGFGAGARGSDSTINSLLFNEPAYTWLTIISAAVIWKLGQFVFRRLILQPVPPEEAAE